MKAIELPKAYAPKDFENRVYGEWKSSLAFQPAGKAGRKPFVIVIPPPNVTGILHIGHGLNLSLQDIVVRFHRMDGRPTLWVPGTDHAGIATQNVVEKRLKKEGKSRHDFAREDFVELTRKVSEEHKAIIREQLAKIGASVDWSRERFTLDEGLSKAVREVFVTLYERGLIYRGKYLVNWCVSCGTALADDEVEHSDEAGKLWNIKYPLEDGSGFLELTTTRPETLLGDTAVAVHPEDPRYLHLHGKRVRLPLADRLIPIVADAMVDREFGTGVVKITPAHDPNDFAVAARHDLPKPQVIDAKGLMSGDIPDKYRGMKVAEARKAVLADLEAAGLLAGDKAITHAVGHCYRCNTVIEPHLSEQWFVKMKPLAEKALKAWSDGEVKFWPRKWENTYQRWMEGIRDWCVSRQLWWGHRIPVWYCDHCGYVMVEREEPTICPKCKSTELRQDPDVLDTWFSSWLWPFSTLGWPKDAADFRKYYPTSTLITAYDIIFFWVARMIMAGEEFTEKAPFKDVYIHGLVRDKQGRKMSKSLGNGIDPLEIVDEYGADAMRFTLAYNCAAGQDILIDKESFRLGSRFANKVWNASRYLLGNLEGRELLPAGTAARTPLDRWIFHRLDAAARACRAAFAEYRYNDAAQAVFSFFWDDFCDWYIEATKLSFRGDDAAEKDRAATLLLEVLEESLRLLHPFLPFVTEEIYRMLPNRRGMLIVQDYPAADDARRDEDLDRDFEQLRSLVSMARAFRPEFQIAPEKPVPLALRFDADNPSAAFVRANAELVKLLANAPSVEEVADKPAGSVALVGRGFQAWALVRDAVDAAALAAKFSKDLEKENAYSERIRGKLSNEGFVKSARPELVEAERAKLAESETRAERIAGFLSELA